MKLIVEVDGEHHQTEKGRERDERRDRYLAERGYTLLRIPGYHVARDPAGVRCLLETAIDQRIEHLGPLTPGPSPSKLRERGARAILVRRLHPPMPNDPVGYLGTPARLVETELA